MQLIKCSVLLDLNVKCRKNTRRCILINQSIIFYLTEGSITSTGGFKNTFDNQKRNQKKSKKGQMVNRLCSPWPKAVSWIVWLWYLVILFFSLEVFSAEVCLEWWYTGTLEIVRVCHVVKRDCEKEPPAYLSFSGFIPFCTGTCNCCSCLHWLSVPRL